MKTEAVVLRTHGGPEVLTRETLDLPAPGPRELLVRVHAVALNHLDLWIRSGLPGLKLTYPHRLGSDIAGEIEAVGPGARTGHIGERVLVNPGISCGVCERCLSGCDNLCRRYQILGEHVSGGYGRHVVVPDANILPFPGNLSFVEGAALPLVFLTAWQMLVLKGRVQPGQTVLIHGASGGVSTAAVQIAKLFGARVFAVTSNASKAERVRALGADEVIVRSTHDFVDETKRLTGGRGADLIVDHVGGDVLARSVLAAAWGGRIVTCGATAGFSSQVDLRHLFSRQIEILGSTMGPKGALWTILDFVRSGKLRPVVHSSFSLWQAADAHRELESGNVFGKVVLEVA